MAIPDDRNMYRSCTAAAEQVIQLKLNFVITRPHWGIAVHVELVDVCLDSSKGAQQNKHKNNPNQNGVVTIGKPNLNNQ